MDGRPLKVGGYTPFSTTDYPGQLAAVVFVQGWRSASSSSIGSLVVVMVIPF